MIDIRPMQETDVDGMHRVHTQAVSQLCSKFVDKAVLDAWLFGRTPQGYLQACDDHGETFWVADEESGRIVGFASWRDDELVSLFVDPVAGGQGIGRRLFAACEADAESYGFSVSRLKSTLNAVSFYELLGFKATERGYDLKREQRIPYVAMIR